jgi:hypothetical protein
MSRRATRWQAFVRGASRILPIGFAVRQPLLTPSERIAERLRELTQEARPRSSREQPESTLATNGSDSGSREAIDLTECETAHAPLDSGMMSPRRQKDR